MNKKILAALLSVCMVASLLVAPASAATFDDVDADHWAAGAIERWADYGVLNGVGGEKFSPDRAMNRAEFAKMVVTLLGLTNKSGKTFPDVEADGSLAWAKDYIDIAATNGIINGYPNGNFGGKNDVKFNEGATMMSRALGLVTLEESSGAGYATAAVNKLTELDMLDENVNADAAFNRAAVAGLADNMIAVYATEEKPYEETVTGKISGVVLVVGKTEVKVDNAELKAPVMANDGASVEIKNSTVSAPIAVDSASVTLTNTKAEAEIVVSGDKASVSADKASTVAAVTVEEGATAPEIKGQGISADKVTNNSTEDVKVNGTTVEGKPEENKPAEDDKKPGTTTGNTGSTGNTGNTGSGEDDKKEEDPKPAETHKHSYEEKVTKPATCADAGVKTFTCKETKGTCEKETYTEAIAPTGHTWGTNEDNEAVCTKCGIAKPEADCGENHSYGEAQELNKASCTTKGLKIETCTKCGDVKKTETEAAGHKEKAIAAQAPTCTKAGLTEGSVCEVCGETLKEQEVDPAKGHDMKAVEGSGKDATCTEAGKEADMKCSRCDEKTTGEVIRATGHKEKTVSGTPATCCKSGTEDKVICETCNAVLSGGGVITANGDHTYAQPNCTQGCEHDQNPATCETCKAEADKKAQAECENKDNHAAMKVGETCACGYEGTVEDNGNNNGDQNGN